MNKLIKLSISLFLIGNLAFGQLNGNISGTQPGGLGSDVVNFNVDTPVTGKFENFISNPAVTNSGKINISQSLYELTDYDLSLNILLSYNTGGIKVDSKASRVGTGWNLIAGGSITRTIRDLPDDAYYAQTPVNQCSSPTIAPVNIGWLHLDEFSPNIEIQNFPENAGVFHPGRPGTTAKGKHEFEVGDVLRALKGADGSLVRDIEPDIYHFNVNGKSFDFLFTENGVPKILGLEEYKIEYEIVDYPDVYGNPQQNSSFCNHINYFSTDFKRPINKFIITDISGYKYIFYYEDAEKTTTTHKKFYYDVGTDTVIDLNETYPEYISAWHLSKIISPTGKEILFEYETQIITEKPKIPALKGYCESGNCTDQNRNNYQLMDFDPSIDRRSSYTIHEKDLIKITTRNHQIDFISGQFRLDSNGGKVLDEIKITSRITWNLLYKHKFNYYYENAINCPSSIEDSTWCKRLFLSNLEKISQSQVVESLTFEYDSNKLPHRFSFEQDFWGFYNGNNAQSLIPKLYVYPNSDGLNRYRIYPNSNPQEGFVLQGANRDVNPNKVVAGTLKKIIFPTGGFRDYVFEPNQYYDSFANNTLIGGGLRIKEILHYDGTNDPIIKKYKYQEFTNGLEQSSGLLFANPVFGTETNFYIKPGNTIHNFLGYWTNKVFYTPNSINNWVYSITHDENINTEYDVWNRYTQRSSHPYNSIFNKNGDCVIYTKITESSEGNGRREYEFNEPELYTTYPTEVNEGIYVSPTYGNLVSSIYTYGSFDMCVFKDDDSFINPASGSYVGNLNLNGINIMPYPQNSIPTNNMFFQNGMIKKITDYSEQNDKVKETHYEYQNFKNDNELVHGLIFKTYNMLCPEKLTQSKFAWSKYHYILNYGAKVSRIRTLTFNSDNSTSFFEEIDDFNYSLISGYTLLTKKKSTIQNNKFAETNYFYPGHLSGNAIGGVSLQTDDILALNTLLQNHRYLSKPILTEELILNSNNEVLGKTRTLNSYVEFQGFDDFLFVLPKTIKQSKNIADFEKVFEIVDYDDFGNPIEVKSLDSSRSSFYVWGYNKRVIIAKIDNYISNGSLFSAIYAARQASDLTGSNPQNEINLSIALENLRNNLGSTNSLITTYTYRPLIGVTSITDPRGYTSYYEYDDFNRLKHVKDEQGNILSENEYNYANQN
jgi:hypothetical protein